LRVSPHARIVLATLRVAVRTAVARSGREATGEVLAITTAVYSSWAGARTANGAPGAFAWAILAVLLVISALGGWAVSAAIQRSWRRLDQDDHELPLLSPGAWGELDLGPPSTSPQALVEVAELEALWRQSRHQAGTD
jgi:hypothetical protein